MDERIHVYNCDKVDYMDDQYFLIHATEDSTQTEAERYSLLRYKDFYNKRQLAKDDGAKKVYDTALKACERTEHLQNLIKREREKLRQKLSEKYPVIQPCPHKNTAKQETQEVTSIKENKSQEDNKKKRSGVLGWIIGAIVVIAIIAFNFIIYKGDILAILRKIGVGSALRGVLFLPLFAAGAIDTINGIAKFIDSADDDGKFSRMSDWKQTLYVGFHAVSIVMFFIILYSL